MFRQVAEAEILMDLGRDSEAETRLRAALQEYPQSSRVLLALAMALHHQGQDDEAEDLAGSATALEPESSHGYLVLSDILLARDKVADAGRAVDECLRLAPHEWTSHYASGRVLLSGKRPRVRDAYDRARACVELAPDQPAAHTLVGLCLARLGNQDEAERAYRRALAIDPNHTMAQNNLATLHLNRGRLGSGARMLRQAVSQAPQERTLHRSLNRVLLLLGRRVLAAGGVAGAVLGVMIIYEAPWWSRSLAGAAFIAGVASLLHQFRTNLPPGVSDWGREALDAVPRRWQLFYALLFLVVLVLAFAPSSVAAVAGAGFLTLLRIVGGLVIIGWIVGALISLVRRR